MTYEADGDGRINFEIVSNAQSAIRNQMPLASNWKDDIEKHRDKKGDKDSKVVMHTFYA